MKFENVEVFESWLKENLKDTKWFDINIWLEDVEKQCNESDWKDYELAGINTKSGLPEVYFISEIKYEEIEEDTWEKTIIF